MAKLKWITETEAADGWVSSSGNSYIAADGCIEIPDGLSAEIEEALATGFFERIPEGLAKDAGVD